MGETKKDKIARSNLKRTLLSYFFAQASKHFCVNKYYLNEFQCSCKISS